MWLKARGAVGRVEGKIEEERLLVVLIQKAQCFALEEPSAVSSFILLGQLVISIHRGDAVALVGVEVDSRIDQTVEIVEALLEGKETLEGAEIPLAEDTGGVAHGLEDLGENGGLEGHALTFQDGVGHAILERMTAGHDGGTGGCAGGTDQEAGEARALVVECVEVGGLDPGVAVPSHRAVTLVVSDDENDIGSLCRGQGCEAGEEAEKKDETFHGKVGYDQKREELSLQGQKLYPDQWVLATQTEQSRYLTASLILRGLQRHDHTSDHSCACFR